PSILARVATEAVAPSTTKEAYRPTMSLWPTIGLKPVPPPPFHLPDKLVQAGKLWAVASTILPQHCLLTPSLHTALAPIAVAPRATTDTTFPPTPVATSLPPAVRTTAIPSLLH